MKHRRLLAPALALLASALAIGACPGIAQAHGPIAPVASSYLANITQLPAGLQAKVVDGDLRLWLRAPPDVTVVILDPRRGPYLRFSPSGVQVNLNSQMYYQNQTPAEIPPAKVSPSIPPRWQPVSGGHAYEWHDGRLHALATVALAPGTEYVGRWSIPVLVAGHPSSIAGGLRHARRPSIVWFWPILVLITCVIAARRLRSPALNARVSRALALGALLAIAIGGAGQELHGRPAVSVGQLIYLFLILAFVAWGASRTLRQRPGQFGYFLISFAALWEGGELIPTLVNGFVLTAVPPFAARAATVLCLGCGAGLFLVVLASLDQPQEARSSSAGAVAAGSDEDRSLWESHV